MKTDPLTAAEYSVPSELIKSLYIYIYKSTNYFNDPQIGLNCVAL